MPYRVDIRAATARTLDRLIELGAIDVEPVADGIAALMPDRVRPEEIAADGATEIALISPALGRDADSVWILTPRPIRSGRLLIVPAEDDAPGAIRLVDSPAFGTGLHPTTALCLQAIDEIAADGPPEAMLDIGTGSGVLALAALHLGVPHALGIDLEEEALRAAAENARLNGVAARLVLTRGGPEVVTGAWPLVVANVLAAPLIEMAPALVRRVGHRGLLILSGIPSAVGPDVERTYQRLGLHHVRTAARNGWVALVLQASW